MPATKNKIVVDPHGMTLSVDIADFGGTSITAYTASGGASTHTLPLSISTPTEFYVTSEGAFTVTASLGGVQVMSKAVDVRHGAPVTVDVSYPSGAKLTSLLAAKGNVPASPTTYTQTYSTAASTVPAATVTSVAADADTATIATAINALAADVLALKKVITRIIDDLQAAGLAL